MSDSFVDEHERRTSSSSLKGIPIPDDIKDEFRSFFDSSSNPDDFKFIFDLNQYNSVSIWKDSTRGMDKTEQRIPFETPTGMKTIDHYFSKRSSLNKPYDSSIKEKEKSSKQSKTVSQSPIKSNNDKNETEPILSPSKKQLNNTDNILSQDIFDKDDSVSSNEYSKQNEEILGECDVVPCTQFNESIVSRFNSSNLINSGSVANGSSDSESDCDKSNVSSFRKSCLTSEDDVKHSKNSSERSLVIQKGKDRMKVSDKVKNDHRSSDRNAKSPLKVNTLVKTRKTDSSSSSSDEERKSSSKAMNTSVDMNKSNVRKTNRGSSSNDEDSNPSSKFNISATLNELKYKKKSESSSSSDGETKVTASVGMSKLNQRKSCGSNSSSSDEENKSSSKTNTSMKMNKSLDKKSSVSSSSTDEESKSSSKANTSMNLNKSKDKKSSVSSSSSDEENKSSSKANTSMKMNKSLDKKSSVSSSSSDEENKSSSKTISSMNLNKSKDKKSSGGSLSSDGNRKSVPQSSASKMSNSSRLKDSDSSSDDEETRSVQKASIAKNKIQLSNKEISSSSDSDSENEVDKRNVSVDKRKPTSSLNSRNNLNSEDEKKHLSSIKLSGKVKNNEELRKNMIDKTKSNFNVNRDSSDSSDAESDTEKNCVDIKSTGSLRSAIALKKSGQSGSDESDNDSGPSNSNLKKLENKWATEKSGNLIKGVSSYSGPRNDSDCSTNSVNSKKNIDKISSNLKTVAKRSGSDSSSDDNEFSFKNKEIGKILGLNAIGSTRNMSLSGHKIAKSLENNPEIKISPKKNDQSGTEDSESDSSSSEDERKKEEVNLKKVNPLKDQTMLFAPSASSSFMVYSTPNPLSKHAMKMTQIESVRKEHHIKGLHSPSGTPLSHEQTVVRNVKESLKRKRSSDSDEESDKSDSRRNKFQDKSSSKRKRTDSNSESTSSEKLKKNHKIASDLKMEVDRPDSSTDDEDSVKTKRPDWLEEIVKNKRQITAGDKLKVENSICFEDISSEDEIYTLQCPKELNIESLVGKKISLTGESLFEGLTKDKRLLAFETFAVSLPSMINLLLPSKIESTLRLGGFEVKGSIIVSERCLIPEVDMSTFSSTGRESSSDDELNISTPLPSGLKLRHPLHGLNYKKTALPNFDAVISKEKKHHKKKKKKHDEGETVEEMIDSLLAKKELSLKGYSDEFKKPLAPKSKSRSSGKSKEDSDRESERGIVIGKNMISLVSEDESRSSSKEEKSKKKKKNKKDNAEVVVQEPDVTEDSKQSKKKKKKDKMMEQMIREAEGSIGITLDPCESEGSLTKTKKEKKRKRDKAEEERPAENYIPVEESQPEIKKKKKKKNKEKDID